MSSNADDRVFRCWYCSSVVSSLSSCTLPNSTMSSSKIYSKIFAETSRRFAGSSFKVNPPLALWAFPGFVGFSWFIWGALTEDIKSSVGLYWDPDRVLKRVEAEREQRIKAEFVSRDTGPEQMRVNAFQFADDASDVVGARRNFESENLFNRP